MDINWFDNPTEGYHITLDGENVHYCITEYERDMFIAELKIIQEYIKLEFCKDVVENG